MRILVGAFGLYQVAQAAWMTLAPRSFYDAVAAFGTYNDHYIRDVAAFTFGLGAILLISAGRSSWRAPALAVNALAWSAHALNHLWDIGDTDPGYVGVVDFVALAAGALVLAWLAARAATMEERRTR